MEPKKYWGGAQTQQICLLTSNSYCRLDCVCLTQISSCVIIGWAALPPKILGEAQATLTPCSYSDVMYMQLFMLHLFIYLSVLTPHT